MFFYHFLLVVSAAMTVMANPQNAGSSPANSPSNAPATSAPNRQCVHTGLYCCKSLDKPSNLRTQMEQAGIQNAKYVSDDLTVGTDCEWRPAPWLGGSKCTGTTSCCWGPALKQTDKTRLVFDCMNFKDIPKKPKTQ
ncbi:hypothetical protein D9756_011571 [Leucocoprinus leucothites]|uniref:Hydrophobin n=1 Tax=Leucocoprinus leucothites TaxID=201217 RepID=A0A8H5CM11_9AGAR|nr:hypothetical protein D9756_011571 [Leucoagaricus leucothites]